MGKEEKNLFQKYLAWRRKRKAEQKKKKPQTFSEIAFSWVKTIVGAVIVVMIINGLAIASFVVPTGSMENTVMTGDFLFVNKFTYGPSTPQVIPFVNIPLPYYKLPPLCKPERGDVIVFVYPGDRGDFEPDRFQYFLKRCVAIHGDTLQIINKRLHINGKEMKPPEHVKFTSPVNNFDKFRTFPKGAGFSGDNYGPLVVPQKGDTINLTLDNFKRWKVFIQREDHVAYMWDGEIYIDDKVVNRYIVERDYYFAMGDNRDNSEDSRYWGFVPEENIVGSPMFVYWSWNTDLPLSRIFDKFASVRWSRIGTCIK